MAVTVPGIMAAFKDRKERVKIGEPGHGVKIILHLSSFLTEEIFSRVSQQMAANVSLARTGHMATPSCKVSWEISYPAKENRCLNGLDQTCFTLWSFHVASSLTPRPSRHNQDQLLTVSAVRWGVGFGFIQTVSPWMLKMAGSPLLASVLWKPQLVPAEPVFFAHTFPRR